MSKHIKAKYQDFY